MLPPSDTVPWTSPRREIRAWLQRNNAVSLSELYEGAVELVSRTVPGRVRLVAHAVREIRNRLPDALAPEKEPERLDYRKRCEAIRNVWQRLDSIELLGSRNVPDATASVGVPVVAAEQVQQLLDDDQAVQGRVRATATRLYVAVVRIRSGRTLTESEQVAIEPAIRQWHIVTDWFVDRAHDNGTPDGENDLQAFADRFELFERALYSLIQEFYPATKDLDEILEEANS
jgi:hypothetical protein